ncbi:diguanylate cyclase [Uliginosibacterium paludis]|uniref:Diguanylate cyclase n=1 Tax=Uliginosibacterium paludis TaxID=1615952 RepID=A0ABV2CKK8_9RHOO
MRVKAAIRTGLVPVVALCCFLAGLPSGVALTLTVVAALGLEWRRSGRGQPDTSQTQAFVQRLIDVIPEPVYVKDSKGCYVMINAAFSAQRGMPASEILGRSARDLAPDPETAAMVAAEDAEVLAGRNVYKEDITRAADGRILLCRIVTKGRCYNSLGERVIVGANFNVTGLRQAEQQLQAALAEQTSVAERTRDFIQTLLDEIPYPMYVRDAESRYRIVNRAMLARYGLRSDEVIGKTIIDLHPEAEQSRRSWLEDREVLAGLHVQKEEYGQHPVHGTPYYQIVIKGSCPDTRGEPVIVGINIDVTDLRESEKRLAAALEREREQHHNTQSFVQRLLDLLPWPVYVKDAQSRYIMLNEAMSRDSFIPRDELLGSTGLPDAASATEMRSLFEEDGEVLSGRRILREEQIRHPNTGKDTFRILAKARCLDALGEPVIVGTMVELTELRQAERELKAALEREIRLRERTEAFIQRLIDVIPDPFYVKREGHYILINEAFATYHGKSRAELLDPARSFHDASEASRLRSLDEDARVLQGAEVLREERTRRRVTGEEVYRVVSKTRSVYIDGEPVIVGIDHHITSWRRAEQEIKHALERETQLRENTLLFVQRLIDLIPDPVYVKKSGGLYVLINKAFLDYHQREREEVLAGPNSLRYARAEVRQLSLEEDEIVLAGGDINKEEHTTRQATGEEIFRIVTKHRSTYFDGEPVVVGIDHQITRWRIAERELQRLAREDALTGLANRRHFMQEAERALLLATRYDESLSLIMFDLDHFKLINDQWGHNAGDEVLRETVARCLVCLRATDLLARWGGEEFIILLPHTHLAEACQVAERLREALEHAPINSSRGRIRATLSAGVAQWEPEMSIDQFVSTADTALYAAKQNGRNRVQTAPGDGKDAA